jgi:hypothetical protein
MGGLKVAKETVYLDADGETTTDETRGVELYIRKGQEITIAHAERGVKGVEPEAENKSDAPEAANKSAGAKRR